ncbi:butyrate kinase [Guggenheimella bovis]
MAIRILAINPGSTSTKVSYFEEDRALFTKSIDHDAKSLESFPRITDQFDYRKEAVLSWLESLELEDKHVDCVVGRGGLLRPMPSGTYYVTERMKEDLRVGIQGDHASNLGGLIADAIAKERNVPAFIVDPVAVDEFEPIARISGLKEVVRKSLVHALNVRAVSLRYCREKGLDFTKTNLVVAHLGGGISIVSIKNGKMIDTNDANEMGPFSPERTGSLPVGALAEIIYKNNLTPKEAKTMIRGKGGVVAYLGTNDLRAVEERVKAGDEQAKFITEAMAYQIAKEIGSAASVLKGHVEGILLTGGVAHNKRLMDYVREHVEFIAPVTVYPGEDEMQSLCEGALRVLLGKEEGKNYDLEARFD